MSIIATMRSFYLCLVFLFLSQASWAGGNEQIRHFRQAKRFANEIHQNHPFTIYCNCRYRNHEIDLKSCGYQVQKNQKRALQLEWEHVVPAEAFGHSFTEWREGSPRCIHKGKKYKGRKCAQNNPEFARIEADLYNLWPEIGELNGLRNNFAMAELGAEKAEMSKFGSCKVKIEDRKFEPMPQAKGRVARTYLYMDQAYPGRGIISEKNQKLFEAWDKLHPVDDWECKRAKLIEKIQGNDNPILKSRCKQDPQRQS
jgi:deoxyribonuclease-1